MFSFFKLYQNFIFLAFLLSTSSVGAQTLINQDNIFVKITDKNDFKLDNIQKSLIKKQLLKNLPLLQTINKINVEILFDYNSKNKSYSNGNNYECVINMDYKSKNHPILLPNINKDIEFTLLHEIGHCALNRETMFETIKWLNLSQLAQAKLNQIILQKENAYVKNKKLLPPLLVYHEIFADTFAVLAMKINPYPHFKKDMNYLIKIRQKNKKVLNDAHLSDEAIKIAVKKENFNYINIYQLAENISQALFAQYLLENK